ncbi:MAG TPA: hypothetical protein VGO34_14965 [Alphaproteobacteria bacterium]|jgi:hypothetical protein
MRELFSRMISSDDRSADSIVYLGIWMGLGLILISAWDCMVNGREFNAMNFGLGCGSILAGIGGGKLMRDRLGKADQPGEVP